MEIYHDGSNSYIQDNGTGNLIIQSNKLVIETPSSGENMITATENSNVVLFFDNDAKFATNSGGTATTGIHTATTFSGSGASLTNLPGANVTGQLTPSTGGTGITIDYDTLPTSDPGVKGRLWIQGVSLKVSAG
jgi:hypothetical protein